MKKANRLNQSPFFVTVLLIFIFAVSVFSQYNRVISYERCSFSLDTTQCYQTIRGKTYSVSKEVSSLSDLYRFCLPLDTIGNKPKPIRVILVIDQSMSMCQDIGSCTGSATNDLTNQRIEAAQKFVDTLAAYSPGSEVGVVRYGATVLRGVMAPRVLTNANVTSIKNDIAQAACGVTQGKALATYPGVGVDTAMDLSDLNYTVIKDSLVRHIIILTDGDWSGTKPAAIIGNYMTDHPGRPLPIIHGVFLTNITRHRQYGFPDQGLVTCGNNNTPSDTNVPVDLQYLNWIADTTKGYFFNNETPESIVDRFQQLLGSIILNRVRILTGVTVKNLGTLVQQNAQIQFLNTNNDYVVKLPAMPIDFGTNRFEIAKTIRNNAVTLTEKDTLTIYRSVESIENPDLGSFIESCTNDTIGLSITCTPRRTNVDSSVTVNARVAPANSLRFAPDSIVLRAFTVFPNSTTNTLAIYHLDGNANDALGVRNGTGTPQFHDTAGAFSGAMTSGSFSITLSGILSDFTFEAWINPYNQTQQVSILSGNGATFGVNAAGFLFFSTSATTITSKTRLDRNTWQHVAVARANGSVNLYVNGLEVATATPLNLILSGAFTVGPLPGCFLDEMRISSVRRTVTIKGLVLLDIPTSNSMSWVINNNTYNGTSATLPPSAWHYPGNGQTMFFMSNSQPQFVVVNLLHTTPSLTWSKNGDPVVFRPPGIPLTAVFYDTTGDGHIDKINIRWTSDSVVLKNPLPSVASIFQSITVRGYDGNIIALHPATIEVTGPKSLSITVTQNFGRPFETGWIYANVNFGPPMTQLGDTLTVTQIIDSAGAVINKAEYFPSGVRDDWVNHPDTLQITFSEPIVISTLDNATPSAVFYYYDSSNGRIDTAFNGLTVDDLLVPDSFHALIIIHKQFLITPIADSMQLIGNSPGCIDLSGNLPSLTNRKEPITWGFEQIWKPMAAPNPFKPGPPSMGGTPVPVNVKNIFINANQPVPSYGMTIAIDPLVQSSGSVEIYDPVGNVVMIKKDLVRDPRTNKLFLVWDGRNHNGRYVGGGVYLALITLTDNENKTTTKKLKIGVKR